MDYDLVDRQLRAGAAMLAHEVADLPGKAPGVTCGRLATYLAEEGRALTDLFHERLEGQ